jgi:hypothetical protein
MMTLIHMTNIFETFEYEAEDGKHELGLNCLVQQSFMHVEETVKTNQLFCLYGGDNL